MIVHYLIRAIKYCGSVWNLVRLIEISTPLLSSVFTYGSYNIKNNHITFFFAKNNNNVLLILSIFLLTPNHIRCSKQRFIFQIQGGNIQIITFSQKRKKSIRKEKRGKTRKTGLRFQRDERRSSVCLTDANGDTQPTQDVDGTVHSFWVICFPHTLFVHSVFVSVG